MNNCRDTHNRLLHVDKSRTDTNREDLVKTETTPTHKENRNQEEKRPKQFCNPLKDQTKRKQEDHT